jgi:hypothetical protein
MELKDQLFGLEIECTGLSRQQCADVVSKYFNTNYNHFGGIYDAYHINDDQNRTWKIVSDSSITAESHQNNSHFIDHKKEYSVEFVTPICVYDDIPKIQEIVREIRGAGGFVNKSCGIHVHVNAAPFNANTLRNLVNIVNSKEDILYKALQVDSRRETIYCQKTDKNFLETLNQRKPSTLGGVKNLWYNGNDGSQEHYHYSRYHALNLHSVFSKGTVEFRCMNSSLHAGKIRAALIFCIAVTNQALNQNHAKPKKTVSTNEKYTFRTWLIRMGLNGEEFKNVRKHLLENLEGNIAWKNPEDAIKQRERLKCEQEKNRLSAQDSTLEIPQDCSPEIAENEHCISM